MNKDIIYIDAEDDITAIIGKIKASKEKVIALVPPKRTGVLQSAVNLRLLSKIADKSDKKLVLITNNKALIALTAAAKIPHAKNLQSKPEMAEIAALEVDDGEDIIDGSSLPVGELAKTAPAKDDNIDKDIDSIDVDNDQPKYTPTKSDAKPKKSKVKVPNFNKFRKKLFLIAGGAVLFIIFLVWAIWFAPAATIVINAKTEAAPVSATVALVGSSPANYKNNAVPSVTKSIKKDVSVDFTATGSKTVGTKATGTLTLSNANSSFAVDVPSGSVFSSSGKNFLTTSDVEVPGASVSGGSIVAGSVDANVAAADVGSSYNLPAGSYSSSVDGISAYGGKTTGGESHQATIVTAADVQKASQALVDQSTDDVKKQLTQQFTNGEFVISDSFTADRAAAVSKPDIGQEASNGKATLTSSTTFSMTAIAKSELEAYLTYSINKQITGNKSTQRIYSTGVDKAKLSGYNKPDSGNPTVTIEATGQIGPNIDKQKIKDESKGKHYGDVQSQLEGIKGVDSVDIKFSFFWVNTVPKDDNKIQVVFKVSNA